MNGIQTALLFPGQGAQFVGMGRELHAELDTARALFDRAAQVLGYDLAEICWQGPADKLNSTVYSQPALFVCSLAAFEKWRSNDPSLLDTVGACAGLSLGEYTALTVAGALEFETALRIVQVRGEAMQAAAELSPSTMVSVLGLDTPIVEQLCDEQREPGEVLQIANYLCPGNVAVSGHTPACQRLAARAEAAGAMKVVPLAVAGAFHTQLMQPAVERLTRALADAKIAAPRIPVLSNVDAQSHADPEEIRDLLIRQVVSPVRWEDSQRRLLEAGTSQFFELGPGKVLRGLLRRIDRRAPCENVG